MVWLSSDNVTLSKHCSIQWIGGFLFISPLFIGFIRHLSVVRIAGPSLRCRDIWIGIPSLIRSPRLNEKKEKQTLVILLERFAPITYISDLSTHGRAWLVSWWLIRYRGSLREIVMDRYVSLYLRWRWNEVFSYSIKPRSIMWRTWTTNLSGGKESSNMRSGCNSLHIFLIEGGKSKEKLGGCLRNLRDK